MDLTNETLSSVLTGLTPPVASSAFLRLRREHAAVLFNSKMPRWLDRRTRTLDGEGTSKRPNLHSCKPVF